jgi:transketolase
MVYVSFVEMGAYRTIIRKMLRNKDLKRIIIEISYKYGLSHIGSCLTAVDIIEEIYQTKKPYEKFVLSAGHAHLAHLVVMDKYGIFSPTCGDKHTEFIEGIIETHGIHCDRKAGCDVSTGSLGHGLGIALGMAMADPRKDVYCLISDGECAEGSIWEALQIQREQKITNLLVYANINGWGAYKEITEQSGLFERLMEYGVSMNFTDNSEYSKWLQSQEAHYKIMNQKEYKELLAVLK